MTEGATRPREFATNFSPTHNASRQEVGDEARACRQVASTMGTDSPDLIGNVSVPKGLCLVSPFGQV